MTLVKVVTYYYWQYTYLINHLVNSWNASREALQGILILLNGIAIVPDSGD